MSRDYEPVPGQWYENLEEEESFRVLSVDEDSELVEIEYLDGDIEEIDIEAWHEMDLERTDEPEGWSEPEEGVAQADQEHGSDKKIIEYGVHDVSAVAMRNVIHDPTYASANK